MDKKRDMNAEMIIVLEVLNVLEIDTVEDMQQLFDLCIAHQYQLIHEILADAYLAN